MRDLSDLLRWYEGAKRPLPWRESRDPYRIWISEIMLQQTRANVVEGYFRRFLAAFPDVAALAKASEEAVLKAWEGLGYYSRARNLHAAARRIAREYQGVFPRAYADIRALPGIGEYTAAAVASQAFGLREAAIDANALRVFGRYLGLHLPLCSAEYRQKARETAQRWVEEAPDPGECNQAIMELGALVCDKQPKCDICPIRENCVARLTGEQNAIPLRPWKKARPVERLMVVIAVQDGRVLTRRRSESLLHGLWEFLLLPAEANVEESLLLMGLRAERKRDLQHKQHIFTHRIWEMDAAIFAARGKAPEGYRWADRGALLALPFSSAMADFREGALAYLDGR